MGYTRGIRGVFTGYTYVSGMCRVCVGYVSGMRRDIRGAKKVPRLCHSERNNNTVTRILKDNLDNFGDNARFFWVMDNEDAKITRN